MNSTAPGDCIDNKITKPVIIMDGFDPQNFKQKNTDAIWDLMSYSSGHFGDDLRVAGYDVIVLNFPEYYTLETGEWRDGGADYIERNAMVLIALINEVNEQLAINGSSEEITIIGPSMGGQITRYALKYMEDNTMDHNTRLFISFDSPNHGANIPISVQMSILYGGFYLDEEATLNQYINKLSSVAARQMLIHQLGVEWYELFPDLFVPIITNVQPFHNTWQSTIDSMGYPENLRKVALINGNNSGQYRTPGSLLMHYKADDVAYPGLGLLAEMKLKHLENSGTFESFYFKKKFKSPFIHNYTNMTPYGNIDATPGGKYNGLFQVKNSMSDKLGHFLAETFVGIDVVGDGRLVYYSDDWQCFIPTASSLGFKNPNFNWATMDINGMNLVCEDLIAFDGYLTEVNEFYTDNGNAEHVKLNNQSTQWAMEEIQYGKDGCPNICATSITQVGGDRYMCPGVDYTFMLNDTVPAGTETIWEYSEGLIEISKTANQIVLRCPAGVEPPEERYIRAKVIPKMGGEQCSASKIIYKKLDYGELFVYHYSTLDAMHPKFTVHIEPNITGNQYSWKKDNLSPWEAMNGSNTRTYDKINLGDPFKYFHTKVYVDGCSTSVPVTEMTSTYGVLGFEYAGPIEMMKKINIMPDVEELTINPNPTSDNWDLLLTQDWMSRNITINIYSIAGKNLNTINSIGEQIVTIPATGYSPGIYMIEVITENNERKILKGIKR